MLRFLAVLAPACALLWLPLGLVVAGGSASLAYIQPLWTGR